MNLYAASPESLWSSPTFARVMACSVAAHVAALFFVAYGPLFRFRSPLPLDVVTIDLGMTLPDDGPPEPPPPEPAPVVPPEPKPPEPEPEPEPEPPKQEVEEALVVPPIPVEKPRPPKPPKPPKPPEQKPKPKDVADVMDSLRKDVEKRTPTPRAGSARGLNDPELAAYLLKVNACLRANWVGAQRFQRRRDLAVQFLVTVNATGQVQDVEVTAGSGEDSLDDTAERAILKCSPNLPPPPEGRTQVPITFVPGDYQ